MAVPSMDSDELAKFGYKQELDRSLGLFSSFAAGFSYISIMTGVFELFFFGFGSGGPAFIWTWPAVFLGQMLVALCFAELAGQYPLAGSVYQWSKQIARPFTSWFGGWILSVGAIVTLAAVAVAYQVVAPQVSAAFEVIGTKADIGQVATPGGAKNALLLAAGLVVFTTIINMIGVKLMARINNFGVLAELVGVTLLIILLAAHIRRGPGVIFDTFGLGKGSTFGYFGAFLVAGLMSAYVMYGFDTAGSLAEETHEPRKHAPPAILRALAAAGVAGLLLAAGLVVFTTIINMIGVKLMARINNFGVLAELIGVSVLIILLAVHIRRGPGVIFDTFGLGKGSTFGYFGAFLVAGLMSAYVMYGFDTAGSLAEETLDPRRHAPPAIIRALTAAGIAGLLVILFGEMSVPDIHASALGTSGLPYLVKATLGGTTGDVFLIDSLIAITVCALAVHTGGIRMIFTMGRDGRLPFARSIARVHGRSKTPLVPSIVIGVLTLALLVLNVGNQRAFFVLTSVAIIMFYLAYLCVTGPLLIARLRGRWPSAEHGPYFSLGRWGLLVNLVAVIFQVGVMVNLAWPRVAVYGGDHWYFQWGAFTFTGGLGLIGAIYYVLVLRGRPANALAEHQAEPVLAAAGLSDEPA